MKTYFTQDFIDFFNELEKNNQKEWFHENKKRYEKSVKKPFEGFISALIAEIQKEDAHLNILAKDCILRINRDIRFAKDKSPYNLHYTAFVSNGGRKDKSIPGIFLRFGSKEVGIMGGCFAPSKEQLESIRKKIAADLDTFQSLIKDVGFVAKFGKIEGEAHKRIPTEFQSVFEKEALIANKQFYFVAKRSADIINSEQLLAKIMEYWHTARPLNEFLNQAIN